MKLNNILAIFMIVIALFSCTAEDDVFNDMNQSNNNTTEITGENVACLSLKIGTQSMATKTTVEPEGTAPGDQINSYMLFLLEKSGNTFNEDNQTLSDYKIVKSISRTLNPVTEVEDQVVTKVRENLYVLVVANPGSKLIQALQSCNTYEDIRKVRAIQADVEYKYRPMCNKELVNVDFSGIKGTSSTNEDELAKNTVSVNIEVSQIAAVISLPKFYVKYMGAGTTGRPEVKLTSVKFYGMKETAGLFKEGENKYFDGSELVDKVGGFNALVTNEKASDADLADLQKLTVAAYPNTTADVKVQLAFTVGTGKMQRTEKREYTINPKAAADPAGVPAGINAGYWYNLEVTVKVGNNIDVDLVCKTQAWKDNVIEIPVEEVK